MELFKSRFHLRDCVLGKIFLRKSIKNIKSFELQIIRQEDKEVTLDGINRSVYFNKTDR